jgi:copper(I)-binding protein
MKRAVFAMLLALTGCGAPPKAAVEDAVVNLPAVAGRPGAAYFTVKGGAADAQLVSVTSPQVIRVELHDNAMEGGMMKMTPLPAGVAVPAGGTVEFKPGGKHAMLFDISPTVKVGGTLALTFTYADGTKLGADAAVKAPGAGSGDHDH